MGTNDGVRSILVTGATGLVGTALVVALRQDDREVRTLSRRPAGEHAFKWNPARGELDDRAFENLDAVVHLAGEPIGDGRWTDARKRAIRESRVRGTDMIARAVSLARTPPRVLISASAVGYYGDRGEETVDEASRNGSGFLAEVCVAWEAAADPARSAGIRVVHPRIGLVVASEGGALSHMVTPFRLGLGGPIGSGRQWMSWIHLDDLVAVLRLLLDDSAFTGPVNAVTPMPVRNAEFVAALAKALHRPSFLPMPSLAVQLLFGEMGQHLLLEGAKVRPARLEEAGFAWRHPEIAEAIASAVG
ncbi:MAG: TIGR01777 family oxidoreductase [Phycisphaerales bacterium]|nr:TIGR01777 family oxidoreductase [Phycisphaerales bacterium]